MSSLSYIFTSSFIYFKKYTIKLNSRNTIFGYSSYNRSPMSRWIVTRACSSGWSMQTCWLRRLHSSTRPTGSRLARRIHRRTPSTAHGLRAHVPVPRPRRPLPLRTPLKRRMRMLSWLSSSRTLTGPCHS